ncbi:integrase catalytic domain-containing protein [Trichonephila clavipes]|nr:integrase catalytic domain-containing protein [Trichonephila clavipes]
MVYFIFPIERLFTQVTFLKKLGPLASEFMLVNRSQQRSRVRSQGSLKTLFEALGPEKSFEALATFQKVIEIQSNSDLSDWHRCSGRENPADYVSRGANLEMIINSQFWMHGPQQLRTTENNWQKNLNCDSSSTNPCESEETALRRFISRRGLCSKILTDNAKTFKKSELELKNLWKIISDPTVKAFYASHKIYWQFIIERAPGWGGFYERLIRTVKLTFRKTVGRTTLFRDELETLLIEIEGVLNSRPLT